MELWNRKDIPMPPVNSVKMKKVDIDTMQLKSIFNDAVKIMEKKHILHKEAALLSRYIYRVQREYRGQKGLMNMYKINRGLKRYISLNLQYVYRNFSMMLSCDDDNDDYIYVPTKQMLQYVLVRTQGFCKVMNYLSVACQDAAFYFKAILCIGHNLNQSLLSLSMVSRIWYCARYFMISACQWYDQLWPFLEKLKIKGPCWLPPEYELVGNLRLWLGSDPITGELKYDADIQKISQEVSKIKSFKDIGTFVSRKEFLAQRNEKAGIPLGKSAKLDFNPINGKRRTTDLNAELISHNVNSHLTIRNEPFNSILLENNSYDVNDQIPCGDTLMQTVENESTSIIKNAFTMPLEGDLGVPISRDQFLAQKAKNKSISTNDFHNSSVGNSTDIPAESNGNCQLSMLGTCRNNSGETRKFISSIVTKKKNNAKSEKVLHTSLKLSKSVSSTITKMSNNITKSCQNTAKKEREPGLANICLSPKALSYEFFSPDDSQHKERKSFLKDYGDKKKIDIQKKSLETPLGNRQMESKFVPRIESLNAINDNEDIEFKFNPEQVSDVHEGLKTSDISSRSLLKNQKKTSLGNWEIINGIRTLKDAKVFLLNEKKARAKGKSCVTSQLKNSEWIILFEAINKFLKKKSVLKVKGNKKMKAVMEEIRNTLISFVI